MSESPIRFDDGAAYERMMGVWSRLAGEVFLDWLAPAKGQRWVDVGCGGGAFTELLVQRCAPVDVLGVDPSEGQLTYARSRHQAGVARFQQGGAMALPCDDRSFDAAVMALVLFFVPDPAQGIAEMRRVVKPGGAVCAYVWDLLEPGGFPVSPLQEELRAMGIEPLLPPRAEVSRMDALHALWTDAGLTDLRAREITVVRAFEDFEDCWATAQIALAMAQATRDMAAKPAARLRDRLRARLPANGDGRIACTARANAILGRVPA